MSINSISKLIDFHLFNSRTLSVGFLFSLFLSRYFDSLEHHFFFLQHHHHPRAMSWTLHFRHMFDVFVYSTKQQQLNRLMVFPRFVSNQIKCSYIFRMRWTRTDRLGIKFSAAFLGSILTYGQLDGRTFLNLIKSKTTHTRSICVDSFDNVIDTHKERERERDREQTMANTHSRTFWRLMKPKVAGNMICHRQRACGLACMTCTPQIIIKEMLSIFQWIPDRADDHNQIIG